MNSILQPSGRKLRVTATELKAVILDLDDTIIYDDATTEIVFASVARHAQEVAGVDPDRLIAAVDRHAHAIWAEGPQHEWCHDLGTSATEGLRSLFPGDDPRMEAMRAWGPEFRVGSWRRALADCGIEDDGLARELEVRFATERLAAYDFIPGAEEALAELASRFRLAMITNGLSDVQRVKVERTGIGPLFEMIVVSGELGFGKPHPEIYHHTLRALRIAPEEAIMVGDNIRRDVGGSQAVGMRGVWIGQGTPPHGVQPDITIRTLAELPGLI
jgi:putative hydrolase of the HAD superfamily